MKFSICSYSFHRLLESGKQDMFRYITDSRALGASHLEPWNAHLAVIAEGDARIRAAGDPTKAALTGEEIAYLNRVKAAADAEGLPFGCLAVDGAHIYEDTPDKRAMNRALRFRWLDVAARLGAAQMRIDAGGPEHMPDAAFEIIVEGYREIVARARERGVEVVIENHWGPSRFPLNAIKILDAVEGLGLLFDTNNWAEGWQEKGWEMCARHARATHIKTFRFDKAGDDPTVDLAKAIHILRAAGYDGIWGIESCPVEVDEYEGVRRTAALIERVLSA